MGKHNRLLIERIKQGLEPSRSQKSTPPALRATVKPILLHCFLCEQSILSTEVRQHVKDCWKVELAANEPVPFFKPGGKAKLLEWIKKRKVVKN